MPVVPRHTGVTSAWHIPSVTRCQRILTHAWGAGSGTGQGVTRSGDTGVKGGAAARGRGARRGRVVGSRRGHPAAVALSGDSLNALGRNLGSF